MLELNTKVDVLQEHIEINKSTEEKKNIVLHDVKNHINIIKDLVSEGDEEEALEYIEEFEGNFLKIYKNKFSGNPLVNSILVRKQKVCEENNIKFNVDCKIPSKIQIKQFDLSTVLCNLIDNAIEENLRCEEIEKRYVDISIKLFEQTLLMKIDNLSRKKNSVEEKDLGTSKSGNHGYGIKNIRAVVRKYDGTIKFSNENYKFTAMVYLICEDI